MSGVLALVGGQAWGDGCDFDAELLSSSGGHEVFVLATAAAYENPERRIAAATAWFEKLGARVREVPVLARPDARDPANAEMLGEAKFIYLSGGSPLHLRSVLKDTAVWDAIVAAWNGGAVVAGSSAGAMVLTDPMVDPRGGAFTLGLGLIAPVALITHYDTWSQDKVHRTIRLASKGIPVVGVPDRTAVVRDSTGAWCAPFGGEVAVFVDGEPADLSVLP